uniref:uncharacterized protein n=1 Tax=Myxine glutinosa TaxID=7769 RepID=UPI00358E674A
MASRAQRRPVEGDLEDVDCEFLRHLSRFLRSNDSREQQKELDLALHLVSTPRACSHNGDLLPLIRSTVQLQLHAFDNLKAFRKLEQILKRLAEWERATVMTELHCHLCRILQPNQILSQVDCLTVSAFLEGSLLGRAVLEDNLQALLKVIACTLSQLLQHPDCLAGELPTCVAKVCMKLFQLLPELLKPLLMIEQNNCENIAAVSSILDFLLQGISKQGLCAEGRLYAGGALPLLLGLACSQSDGAAVIRHMLNMQEPNWVCIGLLKARAPALGRDLTACLTLCRALVTCGKSSLLLSQPQPSTSSDQSDASIQGCLLLADVFSAVCRLCENLQETGYRAFQLAFQAQLYFRLLVSVAIPACIVNVCFPCTISQSHRFAQEMLALHLSNPAGNRSLGLGPFCSILAIRAFMNSKTCKHFMGRLYNLVLSAFSTGPKGTFHSPCEVAHCIIIPLPILF